MRLTLLPGLLPGLSLPWPPPAEAIRKDKGGTKSLDLRDRAERSTGSLCADNLGWSAVAIIEALLHNVCWVDH